MSSKKDSREGKDKEVHSANSWETADLGDKQRNEKFLRLMGASKKEHGGKFVIGDQSTVPRRERPEEKHLAEELEEQYEHSMEHRLVGGRRGHLGLGFHPDEPNKNELDKPDDDDEEDGVEAKEEEESDEDSLPEESDDSDSEVSDDEDDKKITTQIEGPRKRESLDKSSESDVKKMKFVK